MIFYDTQIVSLAIKNNLDFSLKEGYINSTVANELFLTYIDNPIKARYYVPIIKAHSLFNAFASIVRPTIRKKGFSKIMTDRFIVEFGKSYHPLIEYNNKAITNTINDKNRKKLFESLCGIDKKIKRTILERFDYIINNNITCQCISKTDIQSALVLLGKFVESYTLKSNFRNSWNDILILSTASNSNKQLITKDNVLNEFCSSIFGAEYKRMKDHTIIDFSNEDQKLKNNNRESKGYINKGWRYKILHGNHF